MADAKPLPARTKKDRRFLDLLGKLVRVPKEEVAEKMDEFHKGRALDRALRKRAR